MDSQVSPQPVMCEACGAFFETRRGLSSHARLHLRQLGVTLSENSGAPIELLYQLIQERDGSLPDFKSASSAAGSTSATQMSKQESKTPPVQEDTNSSCKTEVRATTTPQKMDHQGSPAKHTNHEVHVCQLCGCWYGTRKGLSSHARAHLRQIGIGDGEVKGSPIDFLYRIMEEENVKPSSAKKQEELQSNGSPGSSSKRPSDLSSAPASPLGKRPKTSESCSCVLCGEAFENRKGLASHARSHLRHIGMSEIVGKSSAIDAVEDLVSSGMLEAVRLPKTSSTASSSAAASPAPPSPAAPTLSPAPSWNSFSSASFSPSPTKTPQAPINRAPKAKKGFRLAVDPLLRKPKPEPVEADVYVPPKSSNIDSNSPIQKSPASKASDSVMKSPPTVICEFCGQLFDTRKALSCHARAHLRQLGLTWSIKTSPIDLLKEVMQSEEKGKKESASGKATWTPEGSKRSVDTLPSRDQSPTSNSFTSPLDYSMKEKSPPGKSGSSHTDTSCELCGFDFENRKALASHARAHLRQLGLFEWKADGATSPIELLSQLIRRDRSKVEEITKRYRMGDLYIRKSHKPAASSSLSSDTDYVPGSSLKSSTHHQESKASSADSGITAGSSRHSQGHTRSMSAHGSPSVRSPRGVCPPKHGGPARNTNSHQPPRSGSIPALLPKPPLTPLVKLVGKIYSLKCRFCEEVFHGPLSVQEQWIAHLQKHILSLGYKGKESPPAVPVTAPTLVHPVAV
ncbi:protein Wiz-like isoform X2 [Mugil cephalus]|uniref:protein Wiz-like isoform X2 n=1 Tax=Mugil cephalus TaxID=48193 RepID=UPI001FB70782|nr:protein Wiz-like isoform X2 [Mugil cephalus]